MLLGCIGDDFTGSSDIANTLAKNGMSVTQYNGVPTRDAEADVEAGVVSLKSRTEPVREAVEASLDAARWLLGQGCEQLFFKYCSTFDSTPEGNIGPVAEALADLVGEEKVVFCPAFPATGRSIYQGNLFVNDIPLHESGMKDHPLTPMTDSDLRRWLSYQTEKPVLHLPFATVNIGAEAVRKNLEEQGAGFYIADAILDDDLRVLGKAFSDRKLLTGGSGLALGLPDNFRAQGKLSSQEARWQGCNGAAVILSGSCSLATREQVLIYKQDHPYLELDAASVISGDQSVDTVVEWVRSQKQTPLVYSSADPEVVKAAQEKFGRVETASAIENLFGQVAAELADTGYQRIITAGGETSGAVVQALGMEALEIGPEIAPGVPALRVTGRALVLALKSGNFGAPDFFADALEVLG